MKTADPTFVAVAVLLGATPDEALASLDLSPIDVADEARAQLLLRGLRSADRMTRAQAMAAGVEPVMRELAALEDIGPVGGVP